MRQVGWSMWSRLAGLESVVSSPVVPRPETHFGVFQGHRTLLFAPICRYFEFVKQCFMSHLRVKAEVGAVAPAQRRTAPGCSKSNSGKRDLADGSDGIG